MERFSKEWAGDWNGKGEPAVDALVAVMDRFPFEEDSWRSEATLTWNQRGVKATYTSLPEARERLAISAPPRWAFLTVRVPRSPTAAELEADRFGVREVLDQLRVTVHIVETQITVRADADNFFEGIGAFNTAREVIESKAVTKVPYHMRGEQLAVESSSWTKAVGWVEKHPGPTAIIVALVGLIAAVLGAVL